MTHLPAVVEVADFAVVEVVAYVPVVAYVLVVSRAVAAIAWPEDLGSHPIARPPFAGRPGAPDRWCAGPSDSRVSWLRLARRGVWSCRRRCRSAGGSPLIAFAISATGARSTGGALGLTVPSSVLVR